MKHTEPECRFLTNTHDPDDPKARMYITYSFHAMDCGQAACDIEWQHHLDYIAANIVGRPKATVKYTQKQLEDEGMVGIYKGSLDKSNGVGCLSCTIPKGKQCEGCVNIEDMRAIYRD